MNLEDLNKKLNKSNLLEDEFSLGYESNKGGFCIFSNGCKWEVCYYERGIKTSSKIFEKEKDACEYLYPEILDWIKSN